MNFILPDLHWSYLSLFELIWVLAIAVFILLQNRSPMATMAWILGLALLPGVGIVVYVFFGPRRLARKRVRRALARSLVQSRGGAHQIRETRLATSRGADEGNPGLMLAQLAVKAGEPPPWRCDSVEVFVSGHAAYESMLAAIAAARHHVHLEYYIFEEGEVGLRFRDALVSKARAGLEVRLLVDGLGSRVLPHRFVAPMLEAGVEFASFNPMAFMNFRPTLMNFRTHRKILTCDGIIGFTGGMNVQDGHDEQVSGARGWRDTHVRLEGDAVAALELVFLEDWAFATGASPSGDAYVRTPTGDGAHLVQIVSSGPETNAQFAIYKQYFAAIASSRKRVFVTTPYFVPDDPLMLALITAAQRDVDVRVMVPAESDHPLLDAAARSYFPALLEAGVRIFGYGPNVLHSKTLLVDDYYSAIGTANIDNRSFKLNFEVTAVVFEPTAAERLASIFETDMLRSVELTRESMRKQGIGTRLTHAVARLFSPVL